MRYTRLSCGTISAQDIFDEGMVDTIAGLHGVLHIRDDFIVFGKGNGTRPLRIYFADFEDATSTSNIKTVSSANLRLNLSVSSSLSKVQALRTNVAKA